MPKANKYTKVYYYKKTFYKHLKKAYHLDNNVIIAKTKLYYISYRGILNLIHKMLNLIQIIIQSTSSQPHAILRSKGYKMTKNSREH